MNQRKHALLLTVCFAINVIGAQPAIALASDDMLGPKGEGLSDGERQFHIWELENAKFESNPDANLESKKKALVALRKSAELEYPPGLHTWANQFTWPRSNLTPEENKARFDLLKRAVDLGHVEANVSLGIAYRYGDGIEPDSVKYVLHQCVAAKAGFQSAIRNLESSTVGSYGEFQKVRLVSSIPLHTRPDISVGGIALLPANQDAWKIEQSRDGWTALYVPNGCVVGFVDTDELYRATGPVGGI